MIGYSSSVTKIIRKSIKTHNKKSKKNELFYSSNRSFCNILKEYSRSCTLHGVHYVFREDASLIERVAWLSIVILCFICASILVNTMWITFSLAPTVTVVKDTHLQLHLLPFPAITICPNVKIKKTIAIEYMSRFVNVSDPEILQQVVHFLNVLSLFQHPHYSRMFEHLKYCEDILPKLIDLNATDLMIKVLPQCQELFLECSWHGKPENCCDIFSLQRSEEGFCYSFNSMTSMKLYQCESQIRELDSLELSELKFRSYADMHCVLRRNTVAGTATGMEVFFKQIDPNESLPQQEDVTGPSGVRVQVHYVTEYPEAGMGYLVPAMHGIKMISTIKPFFTESTQAIRHLAIPIRHCYFSDEKVLQISKSYTQKSCLIECRLQYMENLCGCRPYYFNMLVELRFFKPPPDILTNYEGKELFSPLNCTDCLPTCHENMYDVNSDIIMDSMPMSQKSYGYLDIYYRNEGAVKYQRDVTFGWVDLLVSFGGIAGLFLGFSLLSIVEFIYWTIKIFCYLIHPEKQAKNKVSVNDLSLNTQAINSRNLSKNNFY